MCKTTEPQPSGMLVLKEPILALLARLSWVVVCTAQNVVDSGKTTVSCFVSRRQVQQSARVGCFHTGVSYWKPGRVIASRQRLFVTSEGPFERTSPSMASSAGFAAGAASAIFVSCNSTCTCYCSRSKLASGQQQSPQDLAITFQYAA